jgi:hypothetical protein
VLCKLTGNRSRDVRPPDFDVSAFRVRIWINDLLRLVLLGPENRLFLPIPELRDVVAHDILELRENEPKDNSVPKSSFSDFAKSDDKHDIKKRDTRNINIHDIKIPVMKITGKPQVKTKRQANTHTAVKQAALENGKTLACSGHQACSGDEPPLFGVGY